MERIIRIIFHSPTPDTMVIITLDDKAKSYQTTLTSKSDSNLMKFIKKNLDEIGRRLMQ